MAGRKIAIAYITDGVKRCVYSGHVLSDPKDLTNFDKEYKKVVREYGATVTDSSFLEKKAGTPKHPDLVIGYEVIESRPGGVQLDTWDAEYWERYLPVRKMKKKVKN